MTRTLYLTVLALTALTPVAPARAELPAELRVYDDGLDEPGEFGFEIHANRTLSRRPIDRPCQRLLRRRRQHPQAPVPWQAKRGAIA